MSLSVQIKVGRWAAVFAVAPSEDECDHDDALDVADDEMLALNLDSLEVLLARTLEAARTRPDADAISDVMADVRMTVATRGAR